MAFGANLMKKCSKLDEEGNNKWLQICPCVIYAVGEIRGINCSLGQHHHRIQHHLPRGAGQCDSPDCLTVSQSVRAVSLSVWLCDWQAPDTPVSLSLSAGWCCIHIMTASTGREGAGKVILIHKALIHTHLLANTQKNFHSLCYTAWHL